jgi:23S rRNA (guanine745-N1)-methyltransferase
VLADVVEYLRCPHCGAELALGDVTLRCGAGHSFDVARQGYVSLLSGAQRAASGDSLAMVAAREQFLGAGHFKPLETALADAAGGAPAGGCVADLGAGTGRQLARVLDALPPRPGLALDVSPHALRRAARAHPSIGAVGCDAWGTLPVRSEAVGLLMNVFAPRNGVEMARIMAPGARLVVVTPTPRHLEELAGPLGLLSVDERKPERLEAELAGRLERVSSEELEWGLTLGSGDLEALVMMGPSAFHTDQVELRSRIAGLPERMEASAALVLSVWRRSAQAA